MVMRSTAPVAPVSPLPIAPLTARFALWVKPTGFSKMTLTAKLLNSVVGVTSDGTGISEKTSDTVGACDNATSSPFSLFAPTLVCGNSLKTTSLGRSNSSIISSSST